METFGSQGSESLGKPEIGIPVLVIREWGVGNRDGSGLQRVRIATVRQPSERMLAKAITLAIPDLAGLEPVRVR